MSRAFIREADPSDPRCPACEGLGEPVGPAALQAHLDPAAATSLGEKAYYCPTADCGVVYFNGWGVKVPRETAKGVAWPKDPEGPICSCFGVRAADVIADARDGRKDRVKALVERAQGPEARCASAAPDGVPCVPKVLKLFREEFKG